MASLKHSLIVTGAGTVLLVSGYALAHAADSTPTVETRTFVVSYTVPTVTVTTTVPASTVTVTAPAPTTTTGTTTTAPPPPPPPPEAWTVAPPQQPITERAGAAIGLNATSLTHATDYRITDSGDSSVLLHQNAHGSSIRRFEILRAGAGNTATWAKHAVYAKIRDALIEDVWASASTYAADCFTLRMAGATLRRFVCEGAPPHTVTYYQENDLGNAGQTRGTILLEHGRGTFRGNTAIWVGLNGAATVEQTFVLRDLHFTGPTGASFLRVDQPTFRGFVRIEGCTLNGQPLTAAMTNVPTPQLAIS